MKDLNDQLEAEKQKQIEAASVKSSGDGTRKGGQPWAEAEIQTLIKGVNVFPAGTKERWVRFGVYYPEEIKILNFGKRVSIHNTRFFSTPDFFNWKVLIVFILSSP